MDLGGERVGSDSVNNIREVAVVDIDDSVEAVVVNGNDVDSSGSCVNETLGDRVDSIDLGDEGVCSPGVNSVSPGVSQGSTPTKGYGLKKWKRYRREGVVNSVSSSLDTCKVLKRGVSGITEPSSESLKLTEDKQEAGDFVQPVNTLDNNLGAVSYFPAQASSSTAFAMGAVSENSEDRSSKSSTAASALRLGIGMPLGSPVSGDKMKPNNPSGKGFINSTQMGQLGKDRLDPSKKLRGGERVRYEKEIPHSSLESDSRSSNFVFIQTSNRRQSEASVNYNEESDDDDDSHGQPHFTDDQTSYIQENAAEAEDISAHDLGSAFSWEGNEENDGNYQSPTKQDPLADSIATFDSARAALEKEVQKLKEIWMESYFTSADTAVSVNSSEYSNGEDMAQNANDSSSLVQKISILESTLEEARDALRIKDLKVNELEATLQLSPLHNGDANINPQGHKSTKNLQPELDILFTQKLETDIKFIATANALSDTQTLLSEQKVLSEEQLKISTRLEKTESKVGKIKRQTNELETYSAEHVNRRISKLTWHSLTQLVLLLVALRAVYLQLISDSGVIVPT